MTLSNKQIASPSSPNDSSDVNQPVDVVVGANPNNEEVDLNTLNKIRDLLFGQQVQKHEQQLNQLGHRLDQEYADLRHHIDQGLQSLEASMRKELKALTKTLKTNHDEQTAAVSDLHDEYETGMAAVEAKIERLGDDFNQKHDELRALLEREVQELNTVDDADRAHLADLFSELALNIRAHR
ncbi:hypothetical protein [Acaryochloris sp. IP29b_bin.148]|uniref:hypothetical protein n=1 Tax=Acaryochloris sp. IP29b_bin.148 TaxID=2969218 RepID=UPI002610643F|nr:hypothetical protein [Acaryochloris sp. IP29b_bin.148]